jgi:acetoin utilization protein AcuB
MTHQPITIGADEVLRVALEKMEAHQIQHLPVLNRVRHLIGIVSDRDCRLAMQSPFTHRPYWHRDIVDTVTLRHIMTPAPITIDANAHPHEAARLLLTHQIGCLPVMRDETLVGIITRSDLLMAYLGLVRE